MKKGLSTDDAGVTRCWWGASPPDYAEYHDREWGRPMADDARLFEKLCLEGFQSGLSWLTILRKRDAFRRAFHDFDVEKVARMNARSVERLMRDASIVRNRAKIEATLNNARRVLEVREEFGTLAAYAWQWEPPADERPKRLTLPVLMTMAKTPMSIAFSKDLKRRGFTFVGPTTVYAFMQAMGLVNDHLEGCHAREPVERARVGFRRPRR